MKKIVLFVIGLAILFIPQVSATSFCETKHDKYHFVLSKDGVTKERIINYVTDVKDYPYYDIMPERAYLTYRNYDKKVLDYDMELKKRISEILYFGYQYKENDTYNYYWATQYLLYDLFGYSVDVVTTQGISENFFQKEINAIETILKQDHFLLKDFVSDSRIFSIDDTYILDNYDIQGNHLEVVSSDNEIEVHFLDNVASYTIEFIPKNDCSVIEYWLGETSTGLLHMNTVCEKKRSIVVTNDGMPVLEEEENPPMEDEVKLPNEKKKETIPDEDVFLEEEYEIREVVMPSTSKFSHTWIFLLILLGNIYYVFKK